MYHTTWIASCISVRANNFKCCPIHHPLSFRDNKKCFTRLLPPDDNLGDLGSSVRRMNSSPGMVCAMLVKKLGFTTQPVVPKKNARQKVFMLEWNAQSEPRISRKWMDFGMIFVWDFGDGKMSLYSVQSVFQGFTSMTFAETLVICSLKKEPRSLMPRPSKVYILCQMVVFLRQAKWIPWQGHSTAISAETGYSWQEMVFASFVSW